MQAYVISPSDVDGLCLGVFGKSRNKVCLAEASADGGFCGAQLHREKAEVVTTRGDIYLVPVQSSGGRKSALINPHACEKDVDWDTISKLMTGKMTPKEWEDFMGFGMTYVDEEDDSDYSEEIQSHTSTELSEHNQGASGDDLSVSGSIQFENDWEEDDSDDASEKSWKEPVGEIRNRLTRMGNLLKRVNDKQSNVDLADKVTVLCDNLGDLALLPYDSKGNEFESAMDAINDVMRSVQTIDIEVEDLRKLRKDDEKWVTATIKTVHQTIQQACIKTSAAMKKHIENEIRLAGIASATATGGTSRVSVSLDTPLQGSSNTLRDAFDRLTALESSQRSAEERAAKAEERAIKAEERAIRAEDLASKAKAAASDLRSTVKAITSTTGSLEHPFTSKQDVANRLRAEGMENVTSLPAFTDACSLLHHGQSKDVKMSEKTTQFKQLQNSGFSVLAFTVIEGCQDRMLGPYTGAAQSYESDKCIHVLTSREKFTGRNSTGGEKSILQKLVKSSGTKATTYVKNNIPGGVFQDLATAMITKSKEFHEALLLHFDDEYNNLTQSDFRSKDVLQFLSDQFAKMFESFYDIRCHAYSTSDVVDKLDRLSQHIWITIQCHEKMTEFLKDGIPNHQLMQSALSRFSALHSGIKPSDIVSKSVLDDFKKEQASSNASLTTKIEKAQKHADNAATKADAAMSQARAVKK